MKLKATLWNQTFESPKFEKIEVTPGKFFTTYRIEEWSDCAGPVFLSSDVTPRGFVVHGPDVAHFEIF